METFEPKDKYEQYIVKVLSQNPDIKIGINLEDLHRLDINTKIVLIRDLQFGLGIYLE